MNTNDFINSIDNILYNRIRQSKSDAECRRYLKEHLQKQLKLYGVVGQSEQLSDKKVMTIEEWMKVHKITPYKTSCDVNGRVACKSVVEEWYKQYVDRTKA